MTMLSHGVDALAKSLKRAAGVAVTIKRDGRESDAITATPALTTHVVEDEATGIPTKIKSQDWIFTAADLVIAGQTIRPKTGDQITRASDGATFTVAPIAGRPCSEPHDAAATMIVIHTKEN